jgi:hypothetical protein
MTKAESKDDPTDGNEEAISARKQQKTQVGAGVITRAQRRAIEQQLRSQATGVGIALEKAVNKKIVFDDSLLPLDDVEHDVKDSSNDATSPLQAAVVPTVFDPEYPKDPVDDDDDDKVEEVKASTAQDMALEQRQEERLTARTSTWTKKTRRKRKATAATAVSDMPDPTVFDDEFFQQIDQERQDERQRRRAKTSHGETAGTVATGRHTTFVVASREDAVGTALKPKSVGHGVEVVVLGCDHQQADTATDGDGGNVPYSVLTGQSLLESHKETPSPEVVLYSRSGILSDGSVPLSSKQTKKMKQAGHVSSHRQVAPTWQRSKKMRVVAFGTRKQPKAAAQFVVSRR